MSGLGLIISPKVGDKLKDRHGVRKDEVEECFLNKDANLGHLNDVREDHQTDPPTMWFISETDKGRRLKIVWINSGDGPIIKTAYEPNENEERIYTKYAK